MAIITKLLFVGLSFFLILAAPLQAQETPGAGQKTQFHEVSFDEEGSVTVINQILVDGGVLWVGTDDGLWRFDGHVAECWDGSCSNPEESIYIHSLLIDSEYRLWIGTNNSLIVLNADRDWSKHVELLPELDGRVWVLEAAPDGSVWVGTERGLYNVALAAGTTISPETTNLIELPAEEEEEDILALAQADSGDLWIGTRTSGLILLQPADDGQPQITEIAQTRPQINALLVGEEGELWVGKENGLCTLLSGDSDPVCRTPPFDEDRIEQLPITGVFPDPSTPGAIWIATPVQLWHYAPSSDPAAILLPADVRTMAGDTDDCKDVRTMDDDTDGCKDVRTMDGDDEGQLWAGATTGLFRHQPDAWQPLLDDADPANVHAILQDGQGVLWLGTDRGLLKQEPGGRLQAIKVENSELPAIRCLFASQYDNSLWACLDLDEGVAQIPLDAAGDPLILKRFLPDQTVNDIWQDAAGTLWFATTRGVWQKTGDTEPRQHLSRDDSAAGPASNFVTALAGDGQGGFWAGTTAGLSHFDGSNWQPPACLPPDGEDEIVSINDLVWDGARNQLWVASGDGLALCDGEKFSARPVEGKLSYNDIQTLLLVGAQGGDGEPDFLLLGTPEGLSRVDISDPSLEKLPVTSFSALTGLRDNLIQALYIRDDGRLLLGAPSGLFAYQPSSQAPELSFSHGDAESLFESLRQPGESLTIGYNDSAPLKVVAHDLRTDTDNLIYRFEIANDDESESIWSDSGEIDLSEDRLPKGKELAVTAWAYDGDFNQSAPAVLQITRDREPLEQRPEFQALIIILTIAIIALAWWLLRWLRFEPYQNMEVTISPISEKPDFQQVQVRGGRWLFNAPRQLQKGSNRWFFEIPAEERPRNYNALKIELAQITKLDEITDIDEKLALLQEVGRKLYASLFSDETTALLRDKLGLGDRPVRLRLVIDPALTGADALPWELLYGGDGLWFLTIDSDVALVRDYPISTTKPNKVKSELKVLLLISSPRDLPLKKETINKEIDALKSFTTPDNLKITRHATQEDLQDLTAGRYDLIHFLGHGDIDGEQAILYFEDEGYALPIYQDVLVENLGNAKPTLVFLNACRSAKSDDPNNDNIEIEIDNSQQGSSSLATALVKEANVAAVVGMGYEFDSEAANEFSRAFYQKLVQLGQVDDAVANGREVLSTRNTFDRMASVASRDWFTPRLYVGLKDNAIYKQSLLRQHRLLQAIRNRSAKSDEISEE